MASVSLLTQFPTNSTLVMTPYLKPRSNLSLNSTSFPVENSAKTKLRFNFTLGAASEGVLESEVMPAEELFLLKKQLVCMFYCTNFGLGAASETRAEIMELIMQLEAMNPTPGPTKALPLLNGKWILAYTSFISLYPLISSAAVPFMNVEEISQTIEAENFTVQDCIAFFVLGYKTRCTANARFEVRSPKRVQIKFDEWIIGTPQLTNFIELPEHHVEVLGQNIDLTPFKDLITSVRDTTLNVAHIISNQPPLRFSMSETNVESWLLTTYLDHELRISRGDGGSVFVLLKDGSPLL